MPRFDWFEEDPHDDLSDAQRAFLAALRERAHAWPCGPQYTQLAEPEDGCEMWRAVLDVSAQIEKLLLITVAVCFDDTSIRAGEVHNQSFLPYPDNRSCVQTLEATGDSQHLAQVAADWFEHVMARPVERREWRRNGRIAYEYVFCDTGTGLCRAGVDIGAFSGPPDCVFHARGTHASCAN